MNDLLQSAEVLFIWNFHNKKCVELNLTFFSTLKHGWVTKTIESFLPLINNSVTTGLSFLLLIISAIISSKTINTLRFFPRLYFSIFL